MGKSVDILLVGGKVFTDGGLVEASLGISEGKVAFVSARDWTPPAERVIDITGQIALPGFIDTHVHFRDPGLTYKEDFLTGTQAAAHGGVTCVVDMPNNKPALLTAERFRNKRDSVAQKALVDFALYAGATNPDEIPGMVKEGAIGVKIFMVSDPKSKYPHDPELFTGDHGELYDVLKLARDLGIYCAVHPQNQQLFTHESKKRWAAGTTGPRDFLEAYFGENFVGDHTAIGTLIEMSRASQARTHILHVRTERSIKMIREAAAEGVPVSLEINPKYMLLGEEDMARLGPASTPYGLPLTQRTTLLRCVREGLVDVLATDHAPHTRAELEPGWKDAWSIPFGNPQLDHVTSVLLSMVNQNVLTLEALVQVLATGPAKLIGLYPRKGTLRVGADADIAVVDMARPGRLTDEECYTKVKWSPYTGRDVSARVAMTIAGGRVVMENGKVTGEPGKGRFIASSTQV
ncbi:dihydroorotase family protein [Ferrovibrio sp. MS7]|jgi:dihydroorotase (multifunctional complex type)|uniref:dihydroorotase n=1 Tax=Ferrovibrio plantarum TaxID=3119164 RepID=UPI00313503B9